MPRFTIHDLAATIDARAASGGEASYTRKLLDKGAEHCAKKLGEEAVETVIAAVEDDRDHLIAESADGGQSFVLHTAKPGKGFAGLVEKTGGGILFAGESGVTPLDTAWLKGQ